MKQQKVVFMGGMFFVLLLLGGGGCKLYYNQPSAPAAVIQDTPAKDKAMKVFNNSTGGLSFEYPSTWIYEIKDTEDMFTVNFYKNEQDKKAGVSSLVFTTPMYDTGFETMQVVETKKIPLNSGKGKMDYVLVRPCIDQKEALNDGPCKPQKLDGFVAVSWVKDVKNKESDYKKLKYQVGEFYMDLSRLTLIKDVVEEKKMLDIFDKVIKSLKFTEAQGKSLQEYLDTSDKLISSGSALSEDKVLSLASLVEAFVVDTSTSCGDNWEDEFCDPKTRKWLSESAVLTDKNWKDGKDHTFYFKSTKSETRDLYLGPFKDNIVRLREEAVKSKILLPSGSR